MSAIACCHKGCGASVCFTPEIEKRLRKTHELWMCPFGHSQFFSEKTEMEEKLDRANRRAEMWRSNYEDVIAEIYGCPFEDCSWRSHAGKLRFWRSMLAHFKKAHGVSLDTSSTPTLSAVSKP